MSRRNDAPDPAEIRRMFRGVAPRYDLLNHLLSADLDRRWRRRAAAAAVPGPRTAGAHPLLVDICTGTGDLALALLGRPGGPRVVACDFCRPMLRRARAKLAGAGRRAAVVEADALALPLPDAAAHAACCAFGVRNLADEARGLAEMVRVVRAGGRVVVLEFHQPSGTGPLAGIFGLYFRRILPTLGRWISGRHRGYAYLVRSIESFGPPGRLAEAMRRAGLAAVRVDPLPGGIASLYVGVRP